MEQKSMFVVSGGIKLPIGYRFHPTDEELVVHYLRRKVLGLPLPAAVIPELDVFQSEPWTLPGLGLKEKRYFFCRGDLIDGNRRKRVVGSGYWKATSKTRLVLASVGNQVVGFRRTLVFSQGKHSTGSGAQWVMHEFHLLGLGQQMESGNRWVIYRLHQRKRKPRREEVVVSKDRPELYQEPVNSDDVGPPQPSSPCSSGITEVSFSGLDQDEVSPLH